MLVLLFEATGGYATGYHNLVAGLVTSVRTKVLGVNPVKWLTVTTYYDDRCRVIQTVSDNLEGGLSRVDMKYDFVGNVVKQRESHFVGGRTDVLETENTYDDRGRLLSSTVKLNNGSPATTSYTYDAVGRLVKKKHGTVEETLSYNTRGWLTSKESVPFKMKLRYENPAGGADACWNGNISEWEWQHGTGAALMYGFSYDGVNRLTGTVQKQKSGTTWSALTGSYLEKGITYDRNGNIKTLQRTANGTTVDDLVYSYTGNQLTGLTENVRTSPSGDVYSSGSAAAGSYVYDKNGNMINDSRRALNLSYNVLNLLREVKTGSTVKASYGYLADGTKLRVRDAGSNGFDYVGSLTYKSGSGGLQLESASFGDGVILAGTGGQEVNYFLTDHLGSVRVIVDGSGVVKERNDYYPFGARHTRADYPQLATNRFKFNGKEEQVTGDLGYLDHGARMYDSGVGRWFSGDPLQESYYPLSPCSYCSGNPVKFVDIEGMWIDNYQLMADGSIVFLEKTDDVYDVLYASNSAKKGDVNVNEFVTIYDRTILPSLSGKPTSFGTHYAFTRNAIDAFNLFKFAADNSNVEWGLNGFMHDGKEIYSIRTNNNDRFVRMVYYQYKESNITFSLHSHPWGGNETQKASGFYKDGYLGDMATVARRYNEFKTTGKRYPEDFPQHYIYHKESQNLYKYTPWNPSIFILKVRSGKILKNSIKK